ncbi:MAG: hypothetical protein ACYDDV_03730 [Methanoregula sp.]
MVQFQSRTGLLLTSRKGETARDQPVITRGEQKRVILNANRDRNLSIAFVGICGPDDMAETLEVIAREIRNGRVSGNETKFSWTIETFH